MSNQCSRNAARATVTLPAIMALALVATSCTSEEEDFENDGQRSEALIAYTCQRMLEEDASNMFAYAASEYRTLPQYENLNGVDRASLERSMNVAIGGAIVPTCDSQDKINYQPWAVQGFMHYLDRAEFSYDVAKDRGLVD